MFFLHYFVVVFFPFNYFIPGRDNDMLWFELSLSKNNNHFPLVENPQLNIDLLSVPIKACTWIATTFQQYVSVIDKPNKQKVQFRSFNVIIQND